MRRFEVMTCDGPGRSPSTSGSGHIPGLKGRSHGLGQGMSYYSRRRCRHCGRMRQSGIAGTTCGGWNKATKLAGAQPLHALRPLRILRNIKDRFSGRSATRGANGSKESRPQLERWSTLWSRILWPELCRFEWWSLPLTKKQQLLPTALVVLIGVGGCPGSKTTTADTRLPRNSTRVAWLVLAPRVDYERFHLTTHWMLRVRRPVPTESFLGPVRKAIGLVSKNRNHQAQQIFYQLSTELWSDRGLAQSH